MLLLNDVQRPQLPMPEADQQKIWRESSRISNPEHRWTAFLNQLMVTTLLPWIETAQATNATTDPTSPTAISQRSNLPQLWPNVPDAAQCWEWLNGTAIETESARLLLLPTDALDTSEFRVPQEWVDIPDWVADYYLMIQLNPDAALLQVRGYISHSQLKQGEYSSDDRSYCVDESALVQDLDLLWVMAPLESAAERRAVVEALPELEPAALANPEVDRWLQDLMSRLRQHPSLPLRLQLPFGQWAALLSQPEWRDCLASFQRNRLHQALSNEPSDAFSPASSSERVSTSAPSTTVQLSQWFQGQFEAAWLSLEQLLVPQQNFSFRQTQVQSFSRGKVIDFQNNADPVVLCTTVTTETDGRIGVRVQLRPPMLEPPLPDQAPSNETEDPLGVQGSEPQRLTAGLQLTLLAPSNEALQVVIAQDNDDYIQLPRFKVTPGQSFTVEVRLGAQVVREQFQV